VSVRRVSTGGPWETAVGYSRAVAAGDTVHVSGCTSTVDGRPAHPGDAYAQTLQAIRVAEAALAELGCTLADVVRSRMFVTDIERWAEYGRAHGELLGRAMPAATMVEVSRLIDPALLVEVELEAWRPGVGSAR